MLLESDTWNVLLPIICLFVFLKKAKMTGHCNLTLGQINVYYFTVKITRWKTPWN